MKNINKYLLLISTISMLQFLFTAIVFADDSLPVSFDLREESLVTSVKNQEQTNYCWAFAAMGSLESTILMDASISYDFSESDMIAESMNFDVDLIQAGGTMDMAIAYFINANGPVYNPDDTSTDFYVGDIQIIPPRENFLDNDALKEAILNEGAVYTSLQYSSEFEDRSNNSYYQNKTSNTNSHAVTLIGWDDNYPKENFSNNMPPSDGAFICKNQYGSEYGEKGYFYVSYYDWYLGKGENGIFMVSENILANSNVYSHTPFGKTSFLNNGNDVAFANKYRTSENAELLSGVGFFTNHKNIPYEIFLIKEGMDESILPDKPIKTGVTTYAGYHTIALPALRLEANQSFTVIVKLLGASNNIAIEEPLVDYTSQAIAHDNESYILKDGVLTDIHKLKSFENVNVCLNVLTTAATVKVDGFELSEITWNDVDIDKPEFSIKIKNQQNNTQSIALGLCLYEKKGKFLKMLRSSFIDETLSADETCNLATSCVLPNDEHDYIVKAFIWSTSKGKKILLETPFLVELNRGGK